MTPPTKGQPTKGAPKFADWIRKYGEEKLAEELGVSYWSVLKWRQAAEGQANGSTPRPKHLTKLLELSKGKLKAADIYPSEA